MAETKKKYTLEELYHLYYFTRKILEEASIDVRNSENPLPSDVARFNYYNNLYSKLQKTIEERLKEANDELS